MAPLTAFGTLTSAENCAPGLRVQRTPNSRAHLGNLKRESEPESLLSILDARGEKKQRKNSVTTPELTEK